MAIGRSAADHGTCNPIDKRILMIDTLLTTKLRPPRLHRRVLMRTALLDRLAEAMDYRLTVVQAGAGFGKTTTVAALTQHVTGGKWAWYSLDAADRDPQRFLTYLIAAIGQAFPGFPNTAALALQEAVRVSPGGLDTQSWLRVVDVLLNDLNGVQHDTLLILDDYQLVADVAAINAVLDRLLRFLPPYVHVVLASRQAVNFPGLLEWQAKGEVLQFGSAQLALDRREIATLFGTIYGITLNDDEVDTLKSKTDGWPIALQLAWQGLRNMTERTGQSDALALLQHGPQTLAALFAYLAQEVFAQQPQDIRQFLTATAVLRELTPAACGAVSGQGNASGFLTRLDELGLFTTAVGSERYRYHPLFREFLLGQLPADEVCVRHVAAADYFSAGGDYEQAIHHYLGSDAWEQAADAVGQAGEKVLAVGRMDTLETWLRALPPELIATRPRLQILEGDLCRLRGHLDAALERYRAAEQLWRRQIDEAGVSDALRSQALVYLDSGVQAQALLEQALELAERHASPEQKLRLLEMLAENTLNMGQPAQAEALRAKAHALNPSLQIEDRLSVRILLRSGRVHDARRILQAWWQQERQAAAGGQLHAPAAHRETALLLAFIHSVMGEPDAAIEFAQAGIALGERLHSPMLAVFGYTRLGHAWQVKANAMRSSSQQVQQVEHALEASLAAYREARRITDDIGMRRGRLEIMFGLARSSALKGDLDSARRYAAEASEVAQWCGDSWIDAYVALLSASAELAAGNVEGAAAVLPDVLARHRRCGDALGEASSLLQLALAYRALGKLEDLEQSLDALLSLCQDRHYDFLLTLPCLFGLTDAHRGVPLLIHARDRGCKSAYASQLLSRLGLPQIELHPGFQLRVQAFAGFRVWRGTTEIEARDWRRGSARELFQLLLSERGRWMSREQIMERLRPGIDPEASVRDFKAALAALTAALEPERSADQTSSFIAREGSAYRLRPEADIWCDAEVFERECNQGIALMERSGNADGALAQIQQALSLYSGEFLPEAIEAEWTGALRERFSELYQRGSLRLAEALLGAGRLDACIDTCQRILQSMPCCERAYQLTMLAHARRGERPEAVRTYNRCVEQLRAELDITPSRETLVLLQQIVGETSSGDAGTLI
ncbi:MAG: transcriptional regulator [Burkholderiales bacterium]|nr:transcriptional regulator [Burkholderiales bacterium]